MICKVCGSQVADGEIFCQRCGTISDGIDYPGIKLDPQEALFECVYYGPDYIDMKSDGDVLALESICFEPDEQESLEDAERDKTQAD